MEDLLKFLKCLADENRLNILKLLLEGRYCVCQLQEILDKSQSSVSQHLSYFKELGLLQEQQYQKWIYYSIERKTYDRYLAQLIGLQSTTFADLDRPELGERAANLTAAININAETPERGCC